MICVCVFFYMLPQFKFHLQSEDIFGNLGHFGPLIRMPLGHLSEVFWGQTQDMLVGLFPPDLKCLWMPQDAPKRAGRQRREKWMDDNFKGQRFWVICDLLWAYVSVYVCVCVCRWAVVSLCTGHGGVIFCWKLNSINYFSIVVALSIPRDKQRELLKLYSIRVLFGVDLQVCSWKKKTKSLHTSRFPHKGEKHDAVTATRIHVFFFFLYKLKSACSGSSGLILDRFHDKMCPHQSLQYSLNSIQLICS